ncbi:hypothetical protein MHYP_G00169540 [Metynnis hypsauchen]
MGKRLEQQQMYQYTYYYPHYLQTKQPYAPPPHPMAPPSPGSTSCNQSGVEQLSKTNLYIRGLSPATTDQDLIKLCQPYGKIVSTKAILDKNTNQCKGVPPSTPATIRTPGTQTRTITDFSRYPGLVRVRWQWK